MANVRWTSIYNAQTGFVFANSTPSFDERWSFITECVAEQFECHSDDLGCMEDDDGNEFVTLNGEPIAGVYVGPHTIKIGQVYRAPVAEAAE